MEISKQELSDLIQQAIKADREKQIKKTANKVVASADIDSPGYNTSRLFTTLRAEYKRKIDELFIHKGECGLDITGPNDEQLAFSYYRLMDIVRNFVLIGFNASNNRDIPIGRRREAQERYRQTAQLLYEMLAKTFSD